MSETSNIHGTGLVLGKHGLLLRGHPGAGKSLITLALLDQWEDRGLPAKLVSDDRVDISVRKDAVWMHAPDQIAGLIELRGRGIVTRPNLKSARLHLVVDLVDTMERMVEEDELETELAGIRLPRCPVPKVGVSDGLHQLMLIREAIRALPPVRGGTRQKTT